MEILIFKCVNTNGVFYFYAKCFKFCAQNTPNVLHCLTKIQPDRKIINFLSLVKSKHFDLFLPNLIRNTVQCHSIPMSNFSMIHPCLLELDRSLTIPKPNHDHSSVNNYRLITLLPTIGKLFERMLKSRLEKNNRHTYPQLSIRIQEWHLYAKRTYYPYAECRGSSIIKQ